MLSCVLLSYDDSHIVIDCILKKKNKKRKKNGKSFCVYKQNTNVCKGENCTSSIQPNYPYTKDISPHIDIMCTLRVSIPVDDIEAPTFHPTVHQNFESIPVQMHHHPRTQVCQNQTQSHLIDTNYVIDNQRKKQAFQVAVLPQKGYLSFKIFIFFHFFHSFFFEMQTKIKVTVYKTSGRANGGRLRPQNDKNQIMLMV